jgi:hypothetical protein
MKSPKFPFLAVTFILTLFACKTSQPDKSFTQETAVELNINDFETQSDIANWKGPVVRSNEFHSHGNFSLKIATDERESAWLETLEVPEDWSKYELLKFDIYNPSSRLYYGTISIFDKSGTDEEAEFKGQSYFGEGKLFLNTGWNHFDFFIQHAMVEEGNRPLALDKIRKLRFSFGHTDNPIYIDNIRMVKGDESAVTKSRVDPGDCTVTIDNRNVYPLLSGPVEKIKISPTLANLRRKASVATDKLRNDIRTLELQGYQSLYQRIPLITADVGMGIRSKLVWFQNEAEETKILDYIIESCTKTSADISGLLSARQSNILLPEPENEVAHASFFVPQYPLLNELKPADGYYRDKAGDPVMIFSMLQIDNGPLLDYFAPFNHRLESYTVGGGSRYNIESSPVYRAFHKYPDTHRVGWDGWCGHLIKDRWSMGGKKEDVMICLESPDIRNAVLEYINLHHKEWTDNPDLLYNIMAYELQYICSCSRSQQMFRDWLKSRYSDIDALNRVWNTRYKVFGEIRAPETREARPVNDVNRAEWYDWSEFNNRRFTDYLKWIKTEMRHFDQKIPICAGGTSSMLSSSNCVTGIDEELIINEVDDIILNESGSSVIFSDLLLSLSDRKKVMADPEMGGSPHGLLLQFIHGKSDISKWWWSGMPSREYPQMNESSLPHSKDISLADIAEVLKIGLDIRRLGPEIAEFSRPEPEVVILYSKSSIIQVPPQQVQSGSTPYLDALTAVWEGSRFLGCRIGFVTENQLMKGKLAKVKLLIVPAVKYIKPESFSFIKQYIEKGGTAVVIPESFEFDQYARENNMLADFGISVKSVMLPPVTGTGERVKNYDQSFSQATIFGEVREKITSLNEDIFANNTKPVNLLSDGLIQTLDPGTNRVIARFEDGKAAIVVVRFGKGSVYYLASPLKTSDYHRLLSPIAHLAGVNRPVVGIGKDGGLIEGAEVRAVERDNDYLIYASNLTAGTLEFDLKGDNEISDPIDLRNLSGLKSNHIVLSPFQETILQAQKGNPGKN